MGLMNRTILLALLTLAISLPARADKWAVVVGINHYQSDTISPLRYAEADARDFAAALQKSGGFPEKNIFLFTGDQKGAMAPTRTNLAFRFDYLIRTMGPNDTLVVYFAGHGLEMDGQSFLLTSEADARSLLTLQQSALHARDLYGWISQSKANQVLLLVDACRNDPVSGRGDDQNKMSENMARDLTLVRTTASAPVNPTPASYATLFACSSGQRSYEWSDKGHGFFTFYLVQGLSGAAAGTDGRVTLQSLVSYVQNEVSDASNRWALKQQMPWLRYEGPGADRFELAKVAVAPPPPVAVKPQPVVTPQPVATPEPVATPKPVATPQPVAAPQPVATPKAVATPEPVVTHTPEPVVTPQPVAVATPQPVATPRPQPVATPAPQPVEAVLLTDPSAPKPPASSQSSSVPVLAMEPVTPTVKELRVSQAPGSTLTSLRRAVKLAPYGAHILVMDGTYKEDIEVLRGCTIEGLDKVTIVGTVSTIAPATLINLTIVGEVQHPERFTFDKVEIRTEDEKDNLGPPGIRIPAGKRR